MIKQMKNRSISIMFFCFVSISELYAINFNTLKEHTLQNSKSLQIVKLDVDISKSQYESIASERYPSLSIGISIERSYGLNDENSNTAYVGDYSVSQSSLYKTYSYLSMNYNLYDFGRLDYKLKGHDFDTRSKVNSYCIEQNNLVQKLLDIYYDTRISLIKEEYLKKILEHYNQLYNDYKRLFEIGDIKKEDIISSAVEIADLNNEIINNEKTIVENNEKLFNISNFKTDLSKGLDSLSINTQSIETKEFKDTQIAKKYLHEIKNKESQISLINAQTLPKVSLFGKYDFYSYDEDSFSNSFDDLEENSYKYGINITWQIFDGFKTDSDKKTALLELKKLKLEYEKAKDDYSYRLNSLNNTQKFYKDVLEKNSEKIDLSNEKVLISQRLKNIGENNSLIELNYKISNLRDKLEYEQAKETFAYKLLKKEILLNEDERCTVH